MTSGPVLVTGGGGFVGTNLVRKLVQTGTEVRVLDDFSSGLLLNLANLDIVPTTGSLLDSDLVTELAQGTTHIVHLAARGSVPRSIADPVATHEVNARGTVNVLEAARLANAHVIFSSSSSVYGSNSALPKVEDMWVSPMSPYAASKLSAEAYCSAYSASYGTSITVFRFFNVFGPWQRPDHDYAAVIPRWVWAALAGRPIALDGDGSQTRDFTYVDTVIEIIMEAISRRLDHPRPINLAFGNRMSLLEVIDELEEILGCSIEIERRLRRPADVPHSQNNPALLRALFPAVRPVPFSEALRATVDWMRKHEPAAN